MAALCKASLSGMGGWAGAWGLTQEVQGHHVTADRRHLEADGLAGEGPAVLVH